MSQIIDPDAHLSTGLSDYLQQLGILAAGNDYHVVSIIGAQSSGKSTLLNCLFGTKFETLNNSTGRHQTTLGIHADYSPNQGILILDVEGADSREQGDADRLFERKSALFALALSEVMIVNVSVNDIGRYQASGRPLLKTIFEVNFQLFQTVCEIMRLCRLFTDLQTRSHFFNTHSQIQRLGRTCKKSRGCGRRAL
jgi:energy-coupling factor transporter ATP-binding protein EcfA2